MGAAMTTDNAVERNFAIRNIQPDFLVIQGREGRELLRIKGDGTVTGEIEDASEAAQVFVAEVRRQLSLTQPKADEDVVLSVAHAIYTAAQPFVRAGCDGVPLWSEGQRQIWETIARAALAAMPDRQPLSDEGGE